VWVQVPPPAPVPLLVLIREKLRNQSLKSFSLKPLPQQNLSLDQQ